MALPVHPSPGSPGSDAPASKPAGLRRGSTYFPEVESLRGIAILLVLLHHADGFLTPGLAMEGAIVSPLRAFIAAGQTGVSLFFVLSAWCLSMPFFRDASAAAGLSWRRFYERRALRILPAYWTAFVVGFLVTGRALADLPSLLPHVVFLNSFPNVAAPMRPFSDVWWSLATEVQFYLLLPLLPLAMRSKAGTLAGRFLLLAYAAAFLLYQRGWFHVGPPLNEIYLGLSVLGRGPIFLAGIAAAWAWSRRGERWRDALARIPLLSRGGGDLVLLGLLAALGSLLSWQVREGYWIVERRGAFVWHVAEGALWSLVLLATLALPLRTKALFCNRVLGRIGDWSYSIYLVHLPVIVYSLGALRRRYPMNYLAWNEHSVTAVAGMTLASIAIAACTYRWIEKPFLRRKEKIGD